MDGAVLPDPLITRLNRLDEAAFLACIGPIYEHSPWIASAAWQQRPFTDRDGLAATMQRIVLTAASARQLSLICAHPDLAGRLARSGALEAHSTGEQGGLGLDRLSELEYARFDRLNAAYRARFGMPFVIAVRAQTRAGMLAAFETRLRHDLPTEIATALDEIGRIASFRLADLE